jgi:hypothetical protein
MLPDFDKSPFARNVPTYNILILLDNFSKIGGIRASVKVFDISSQGMVSNLPIPENTGIFAQHLNFASDTVQEFMPGYLRSAVPPAGRRRPRQAGLLRMTTGMPTITAKTQDAAGNVLSDSLTA